ncbi:hypothetical protein ACP179_10225 [Xenorhabdus stockiae]|uniref:hypothetical protein n=1 Tax=Xenorhabdus stockiae TaxID=351614 RepID=UPI003CEFE6F4
MSDFKYRNLSNEEIQEIKKLSDFAASKLNLEEISNYELTLNNIKSHLNDIRLLNKEEVTSLAYEFGSLYGNLIAKKYHWNWYFIERESEGIQLYCVASPDRLFCCPVHDYFYQIISNDKNNNSKLLFNMLSGLDKNRSTGEFTFLT